MKIDLLNALNIMSLLPSMPTSQQWSEGRRYRTVSCLFKTVALKLHETARPVNAIAMKCHDMMKLSTKSKDGPSANNSSKAARSAYATLQIHS